MGTCLPPLVRSCCHSNHQKLSAQWKPVTFTLVNVCKPLALKSKCAFWQMVFSYFSHKLLLLSWPTQQYDIYRNLHNSLTTFRWDETLICWETLISLCYYTELISLEAYVSWQGNMMLSTASIPFMLLYLTGCLTSWIIQRYGNSSGRNPRSRIGAKAKSKMVSCWWNILILL